MPWYQDGVWTQFLDEAEVRDNLGLRFPMYVMAGKAARKTGDFSKTVGYLKEAIAINPHDAVANFRIAEMCERIGAESKAIDAYEVSGIGPINSDEIRTVISSKIDRINKEGRRRSSPTPRLKHPGAWQMEDGTDQRRQTTHLTGST